MRLKVILALITTITFSGCAISVKVHAPFVLGEICVFERMTEQEKQTTPEQVKHKIGRNYKNCIERELAENKRINKHNELHRQ